MVQYWWMVIVAAILLTTSFLVFIKTDIGRFWFDKTKLTVPLLKKMFRALVRQPIAAHDG